MARVKTPEEVRKICIEHILGDWERKLTAGEEAQTSLAEFLSRELEKISDIKEKIYKTHKMEAQEKKEYQENIALIMKQRKEIENTCPHYSRTYNGDPSGGSDSHETCDICGRWFE